jgi:arylsulfatase A-like enzyme
MTDEHNASRRKFLKQTVIATAAAGLAQPLSAYAALESAGSAAGKPNILFIMADDLGWADLSSYGSIDIKTPVLDKLATQGVLFKQAYGNSPVCSASRIAFNTMNYQQRLPIGTLEPVGYRLDMVEADLIDDMGIPAEHTTIANTLRNAGYDTALYGKWHAGYFNTQAEKDKKGGIGNGFGPIANGYNDFFGFLSGGVDHFTHTDWYGNADLWDGEEAAVLEGYSTDLFTERAVNFIKKKEGSDQPFFLNLSYHSPHWPWEVPDNDPSDNSNHHTGKIIPDKWFGMAYPVTEDHPMGLGGFDQSSREIYAKMVENLDTNIGIVLDQLAASGKADNTLVIFTSDNGGERFSDTYPFVGSKGHLYEGGIRVPAITRWPGKFPAGKVSNQVVISFDWSVTMLAAAGIPLKDKDGKSLDGMNLKPIIANTGKSTEKLIKRSLFWRHGGQRAVRIGDLKYLYLGDKPNGQPTDALMKFSDMPAYMLGDSDGPNFMGPNSIYEYVFDLSKDKREQANLIDNPAYAKNTAMLKKAWDNWNAKVLPEGYKPGAILMGTGSPVTGSSLVD